MPIIIPDDLPYTPRGIECLRLGARRGGEGIGCCAIDVFQGFTNAPDAMRPPIPFFNGDSWTPELNYAGEHIHIHGTNEEVFLSYLCHGSFTSEVAPDHAFIAVLTGEQIGSSVGKEWLKILHREGFRWVGSVSNSVYSEYHPNHIFILTRNTKDYMDEDALENLQRPPSAWTELIEEGEKDPAKRLKELIAEGCHEKAITGPSS